MKTLTKDWIQSLNFEKLSPVQKEVLKHFPKHHDLIVQSPTGTGKTHAYLFAITELIDPNVNETQALILAPTRELAMQIREFAREIQDVQPEIHVKLAIGGQDNARLAEELSSNAHIVIATPGKIKDVISWSGMRLDLIKLCIIDEVDMMLDYGFMGDIDWIVSHLQDHTRLFTFSATIPKGLQNFMQKYLKYAGHVQVEAKDDMKPQIEHYLINHRHRDTHTMLFDLLGIIQPMLALIFENTIEDVELTTDFLRNQGIPAKMLHGGMETRRRKQVIRELESGEIQYLVASDLAARGIDLPEVSHVINMSLPSHDLDFYLHRVGRTGRMGQKGYAFSFVSRDDEKDIETLEELGIHFEYVRMDKGVLKPAESIKRKKVVVEEKKYDPDIGKILYRKNEKVKPGYKKKKQQQIKRIQKQRRKQAMRKEKRAKRTKR